MMSAQLNEYIANALQSDFFAGGVALGLIGAAVAGLRLAWGLIARIASRHLWVSVTLDNRTEAYRQFLAWIDDSGVLAHSRRVRMSAVANGTERFGPDLGAHWFWWHGRLARLTRRLSEKTRVGGRVQRPMETITVHVLFGNVALVGDWIGEGAEILGRRDRIGPGIHILRDGYWEAVGDIPRRSIDTVLTDDGRIDALLADVRWFCGASDWYARRGVPWRRGYLLHGPPGTGKTSVIRAVASELELDIASADLGRAGLSDDDLREALLTAPPRTVLVMEDIDAVFSERKSGERQTGVSFSGLLNAVDGVASQEGRALFLTTNHPERLDPALIRPGRADVHVELGPVGAETAGRLFARFFPDEPDLARRFAEVLGDRMVTPAALQGWLLGNTGDPAEAATARGLVEPEVLAAE